MVFKAQKMEAKFACEGNAIMMVAIHRENSFLMIVRSWRNPFFCQMNTIHQIDDILARQSFADSHKPKEHGSPVQ